MKISTITWYMLLLVAVLVFLYALLAFLGLVDTYTYINSRPTDLDFEVRPYNLATKAALDIKLDQAKTSLTILIVLLGVLWGLILVKKDVPGITVDDIPEGSIFILANVAIIINALCYLWYTRMLYTFAAIGGKTSKTGSDVVIPDFADPRIDQFYDAQLITLVCACVLERV
jgi:hypothetical protein